MLAFKEYYALPEQVQVKYIKVLESKTNLMMLSEYTYLFNLAIKSFNKWFNSATCRQTCAPLAERQAVSEIKGCLLLGRKAMTNLDSILKSRDITLPTKVRPVKAMVFQWSCVDERVGL